MLPRVRITLALTAFMIPVGHSEVLSRTWKVSLHGDGDTFSIQSAIDAAAQEDSILVGAGTYNEAINFLGKKLYVISTDGPESTILDATGLNTSVVTFASWEPEGTLFSGFTVTGGVGTAYLSPGALSGGGILCTTGSPPFAIWKPMRSPSRATLQL